MKYTVRVTFEFDIEADDEDGAEQIADSAFLAYVNNPQTGERIKPTAETDEGSE